MADAGDYERPGEKDASVPTAPASDGSDSVDEDEAENDNSEVDVLHDLAGVQIDGIIKSATMDADEQEMLQDFIQVIDRTQEAETAVENCFGQLDAQLKSERKEFIHQLAEMSVKYAQAEQRNTLLESELIMLRAEKHELAERSDQNGEALARLGSEKGQLEDEMKKTTEELKKLEDEKKVCMLENVQLEDRLAQIEEKDKEELEDFKAHSEKDKKAAADEVERLKQKLEESTQASDGWKAKFDEASATANELQKRKDDHEKLAAALSRTEEECNHFRNLLEKTEAVRITLESDVSRFQDEAASLRQENQRLARKTSELGEKAAVAEKSQQQLKFRVQEIEKSRDDEVSSLQDENSKLEENCKKLQEDLAAAEKSEGPLKAQVEQMEKDKDRFTKDRSQLEKSKSMLEEKLECMTRSVDELASQREQIAQELKASKASEQNASNAVEQLKQTNRELNFQMEERQKFMSSIQQQLGDCNNHLLESNEKLSRAYKLNDDLTSEITEIRNASVTERENLIAQLEREQSKFQEAASEIESAEQETHKLEQTVDDLKSQLAAMEAKLRDSDEELRTVCGKYAEIESGVDEYQKEISDLKAKLAETDDLLRQASNKAPFEEKLSFLEMRKQFLEASLAELQSVLDDKDEALKKVSFDFDQCRAECSDVRAELESLEGTRREQVQNLESARDAVVDELENLKQGLEGLQADRNKLEEINRNLQDQLSGSEKEQQALREEISNLHESLARNEQRVLEHLDTVSQAMPRISRTTPEKPAADSPLEYEAQHSQDNLPEDFQNSSGPNFALGDGPELDNDNHSRIVSTLQKLCEAVTSLTEDLAGSQEETGRLKSQLKERQAVVEDQAQAAEERIATVSTDLERLQAAADELSVQKQHLQTAVDEISAEKEQIQAAAEEAAAEKERIKEDLENLLEERKNQEDQAKIERDGLMETISDLQNQVECQTTELNKMQDAVQDLENQAERLDNEKQQLRNQLRELEEQNQNLEGMLKESEGSRQEHETGHSTFSKKFQDLQEEYEIVCSKCQELETCVYETEQKLCETQQNHDQSFATIGDLSQQRDILQDELSKTTKNLSRTLEELHVRKDQISQLACILDEKTERLDETEEDLHNTTETNDQLENHIKVLEEQIGELRMNLKESDRNYSVLAADRDSVERMLVQLRGDFAKVTETIESHRIAEFPPREDESTEFLAKYLGDIFSAIENQTADLMEKLANRDRILSLAQATMETTQGQLRGLLMERSAMSKRLEIVTKRLESPSKNVEVETESAESKDCCAALQREIRKRYQMEKQIVDLVKACKLAVRTNRAWRDAFQTLDNVYQWRSSYDRESRGSVDNRTDRSPGRQTNLWTSAVSAPIHVKRATTAENARRVDNETAAGDSEPVELNDCEIRTASLRTCR